MNPDSNERPAPPVTSFFPYVLPQNHCITTADQSQKHNELQQNEENPMNEYFKYPRPCSQAWGDSPAVVQQEPNQRASIDSHIIVPIPRVMPQFCPIGLQYLSTAIDQLFVFPQKPEVEEVIFNFEKINKYTMVNSDGEKVYHAVEENNCCARNICGSSREFEMKIVDLYDNELIHLSRPYACQSCFLPCCLQKIEIFSPPGCLVGTVEQDWSVLMPRFTIRNEVNEEVLKIKGPIISRYRTRGCDAAGFKILSKHETTDMGHISKQLPDSLKEMSTGANTSFGMNFPMHLDVRTKAVIIGASFLINFMFFEKKKK